MKRKPTPAPKRKNSARPKPAAAKTNVAKPGKQARTKHDVILGLLRKEGGTNLLMLVDATGWQPHSLRGFLAGTVRKKLGLKLTSEKANGERRYRIEK